mgnify:FL=1
MLVKKKMELGKLLLISLIVMLSACVNNTQVEFNPKNSNEDFNNFVNIKDTVNKYPAINNYWLNKVEKKLQRDTIYFALNNLKDHEVAEWISDKKYARIKTIHSYQTSTGLCRVLFYQIFKKEKYKNYSEVACLDISQYGWSFYDIYYDHYTY